MPMKITGYKLFPVHFPYHRPIRWAGHAEPGLDAMFIRLETDQGLIGVGEAPVRLAWTGATLKSIAVVVDEVLMPRIMALDILDENAVCTFMRYVREHVLAKSMIDSAIWDIRAQVAGKSFGAYLGADAPVPVAWTVTRDKPEAMVAEAESVVGRHGFTSLKVKVGQGFETDRAVLSGIRNALGNAVTLSADANRNYSEAEVAPLTEMLAEFDVSVVEDPCECVPDRSFARVRAASKLPVLVDNTARTLLEAQMFLAHDADCISVKVPKTGIGDSRAIMDQAAAQGACVHIGLGATSPLGAVAALGLAGSLPAHKNGLPSEESFFLQLTETCVKEPLTVENGIVTLPDVPALHNWLDWDRVQALAP
jgi:L-alanine-DL-glutamate epimerase-like enolase superfamily enzyme